MGGKELHILWQRVHVGAETCQRCGDTGEAVRRAAERLRAELAPEGIAVRLEEKALLALAPEYHVLGTDKVGQDVLYQILKSIRTALVTARSAPAHERAIRTLMNWNIEVDEAMFLGGLDKGEFLREFEPDFFFDDQTGHIESAARHVPAGHVASGVSNA